MPQNIAGVGYAVFNGKSSFKWGNTLASTEGESIDNFIRWMTKSKGYKPWRHWEQLGYRVVRIKVEECSTKVEEDHSAITEEPADEGNSEESRVGACSIHR